MLQFGSHTNYSEIPRGYFAVMIFLMMLGVAMQSFVIVYERFNMDPMKRGLVNQLCTTYMAFAMCQSVVCIFRDILRLVVPQPIPTFIYQTLGFVGWLNWSTTFGYVITLNQIIFFTYWSKMWLKRVPDYNHDFLAGWLSVANTVVAFYLGGLQAYNILEFAKDEENLPKIRIALILAILALFQALIYAIHKFIEYCQKQTAANSILPLNTVATQEALPQPTPHMALMLNTIKYNPDVVNWKVAFATIFMLPLLFFGYFVMQLKFAPFHLLLHSVFCFYVPLLFCTFNAKLRNFIMNCMKPN